MKGGENCQPFLWFLIVSEVELRSIYPHIIGDCCIREKPQAIQVFLGKTVIFAGIYLDNGADENIFVSRIFIKNLKRS